MHDTFSLSCNIVPQELSMNGCDWLVDHYFMVVYRRTCSVMFACIVLTILLGINIDYFSMIDSHFKVKSLIVCFFKASIRANDKKLM